MESYFLGWGSLLLFNTAIANVDRRSPLKYFLVSLFLGPVVTLLLAITWEGKDGKLHLVDLWTGNRS